MTKGLSSFGKENSQEKMAVIARRVRGETGGLGYWGAKDAQVKIGTAKKEVVTELPKVPEE
jgi:hypothetical protein